MKQIRKLAAAFFAALAAVACLSGAATAISRQHEEVALDTGNHGNDIDFETTNVDLTCTNELNGDQAMTEGHTCNRPEVSHELRPRDIRLL